MKAQVLAVVSFLCVVASAQNGPGPIKAQAILMTNSQFGISQRVGIITFVQYATNDTVRITGEVQVEGKEPMTRMAFHVHAYGNLAQGCDSTGPHFNPTGKHHGSRTESERHVGDLGNIVVTSQKAQIDIEDDVIQLTGPHSIIGRGLVIHQGEDDLGKGGTDESLMTGSAGTRWACGIIGLATEHADFPPRSSGVKHVLSVMTGLVAVVLGFVVSM